MHEALAQTLETLQQQEETANENDETPISAGGGLALAGDERERAGQARRGSLGLMLNKGQGMIDSKSLAVFLDISHRSVYTLVGEGAIPGPIELAGRIKRWSVEEILAWVMNGCPRAEHWKRKRVAAIRDHRLLAHTREPRRG